MSAFWVGAATLDNDTRVRRSEAPNAESQLEGKFIEECKLRTVVIFTSSELAMSRFDSFGVSSLTFRSSLFFFAGFLAFLGAGFFSGVAFFVGVFLVGAFFVTDVLEEPVALCAETEIVVEDLFWTAQVDSVLVDAIASSLFLFGTMVMVSSLPLSDEASSRYDFCRRSRRVEGVTSTLLIRNAVDVRLPAYMALTIPRVLTFRMSWS